MKTLRFNDRSTIKPQSNRTIDSRGYLFVTDNKVARTGVQYYYGADFLKEDLIELSKGIGREIGLFDKVGFYRPPEVVFSPGVLAAYDNIDVTIEHPDDKDVNAYSYREKNVVGHATSPGRIVDGWMLIDLVIKDQTAIDAINNGKEGLSAGYDGEYEPCQGITPEGEKYDMILTKIVPNHIAICQNGRAGHNARLNDNLPSPEKVRMKIKLTDGNTVELSEENGAIIQSALSESARKANEAIKEAETAKARADALQDENATLKAKTTDSEINARLNEIIGVRDGAALITGKITDSAIIDANAIRAQALDDAGIKCKFSDSEKWADADPMKTEARFEAEVELRKEASEVNQAEETAATATHKALMTDAANAAASNPQVNRLQARDDYFARRQQDSKGE